MQRLDLYLIIVPFAVAACGGGDPISHSDSVDLKSTVSSGDVSGGMLVEEKNVNTESGNPYGVFVQAARDAIGHDPSHISVDAAALTLDPTSTNVTALGAVFAGETTLDFIANGSSTRYPVGVRTIAATDGAGPLAFTVEFDSDGIPDVDYADIASGSFKVSIAGPAEASFAGLGADADLTMSFTFTAYE